MHIEQISISNYKSYFESGIINFTRGFNVIVGANNVGKTALVEALSLRFDDKPHRSLKTLPLPESRTGAISTVVTVFHLEQGEAKQLLIDSTDRFVFSTNSMTDVPHWANEFVNKLDREDAFWTSYKGGRPQGAPDTYLVSVGPAMGSSQVTFMVNRDHQAFQFETIGNLGPQFDQQLAEAVRNRIYFFKAERPNVSEFQFGRSRELLPDASNLAEVLNNLQGNRNKFERFNNYVRAIFPEVGWISSPASPHNDLRVRILVWPTEISDDGREDLAIPLAESGTGIGQVLAMLYVIVTADRPRTIIIDEPQSFLNPGAARKLIEILKQHRQHQFIITTHSPEIITAADPNTLLLLKKEGAETRITRLDVRETKGLRIVLSEVGARLADVFGADNILWVEGGTEELCFQLIVEKLLHVPLMGIKIVGVLQTGDFETGDTTRIARIYHRLSEGNSLLPSAIGFIFDRETRTETQRNDIERTIKQAGGRVAFTKRRMYENYLLNPDAIAYVVSGIDGFRTEPITSHEVTEWFAGTYDNPDYFAPQASINNRIGEGWLNEVDGAKVLSKLFASLSEQRVRYEKKLYGLELTQWIIDNAPNELDDISQLLSSFLE